MFRNCIICFMALLFMVSPSVASAPSILTTNGLPLLKLDADTGRIYSDASKEVRLFGVNYLGGSYQYYAVYKGKGDDLQPLKRPLFQDIGVTDVKREVIDRDLDDLQKMGVNLIRIHVLMSDIALPGGALREGSPELDWFDYLMAGSIKRGMYIYLTPITPWDAYFALPERFSGQEWEGAAFTSDRNIIEQEAAFIVNLLRHTNSYLDEGRGRAYGAEPGIGMIGLMNEPPYRTDPKGAYNLGPYDEGYIREGLINRLIFAVREGEKVPGGVPHLVGWSTWGWDKTESEHGQGPRNPHVLAAIRGSKAQFLEHTGYTNEGYWKTYPYAANPAAEPQFRMAGIAQRPGTLDDFGKRKADVVYEWDAPGTQKAYVYPNLSAQMRSKGVQVAAQFQYDMAVEADKNVVWPRHYLNWLYTPERSVAFMIAGETFREGALKEPFADSDTHTFGHTTTSFSSDVAIYNNDDILMYSRSIPAALAPKVSPDLKRLVGVGTSAVATYDGTGLYELTKGEGGQIELTLNPDVDIKTRTYKMDGRSIQSTVTGDPSCYCGLDPNKVADTRTLASRTHSFSLSWPGVTGFRVTQKIGDQETEIGHFRAGDPVPVMAGEVVAKSKPVKAEATTYVFYPE